MISGKPLTQAEYEKFHVRRRSLISLTVAMLFVGSCLAVGRGVWDLKVSAFLVFICFAPLCIAGLFIAFSYKCPHCGTTPMVTRPSFGGGEVAVTSYVNLLPKKCHKCGAIFSEHA